MNQQQGQQPQWWKQQAPPQNQSPSWNNQPTQASPRQFQQPLYGNLPPWRSSKPIYVPVIFGIAACTFLISLVLLIIVAILAQQTPLICISIGQSNACQNNAQNWMLIIHAAYFSVLACILGLALLALGKVFDSA